MPAATATSQRNRQRLDAPQIGEGLWSVFDAQGCCIAEFATAAGDANGLKLTTAVTGVGPMLSVQGAAANINLNLAAQGTGAVVIAAPLEVTGAVKLDSTLEVVGATTLDSTLHGIGAVTFDATLLVKDAATFQKALTQSGGTASFDSPTLVIDETNRIVGVGTATPATNVKLDVVGNVQLTGALFFNNATSQVVPGSLSFNVTNHSAGANNLSILDNGATTLRNTLTISAGGATVTGAVTLNTTLHTVGAVTFDSTLNVGGLATLSASLTVTGNISLSNVLVFTSATSQVIPGTVSWNVTNFAQSRNNFSILDSGATTIQGGLTINTGGITITAGGLTVTAGGITITAGDLTLANAQLKRGTDTWLLPTGLGSDTLVTLTAVQTLNSKTLGTGLKILIGGDATGDLYYNGGSGTVTRIAIGASTTVLVGGSSPGWAQVDRTRVVLTTATGIMTLHDAQTKDAAQTFTAQLVAGPSGTGTHQFVCASSAPSGATFTSAQIGCYDNTQPTVILRQMTNSVEAIWLATSTVAVMGTLTGHGLVFRTTNSDRLILPAAGGAVVGIAALATTATDGFLYIPTCAGVPTGAPTAQTGTVPLIYDTTNNNLYIRNGGTWKKTTVFA